MVLHAQEKSERSFGAIWSVVMLALYIIIGLIVSVTLVEHLYLNGITSAHFLSDDFLDVFQATLIAIGFFFIWPIIVIFATPALTIRFINKQWRKYNANRSV